MNISNKKIKSLFKEALKMFPVPTKALDSNKNAVIMVALEQANEVVEQLDNIKTLHDFITKTGALNHIAMVLLQNLDSDFDLSNFETCNSRLVDLQILHSKSIALSPKHKSKDGVPLPDTKTAQKMIDGVSELAVHLLGSIMKYLVCKVPELSHLLDEWIEIDR